MDSGLLIINVEDPTSPTLAGRYDTAHRAWGIYLRGSYAYVTNDVDGLLILNISDPYSPFYVGSYPTLGLGGVSVHVSGDYAYFTDGDLQIIKIMKSP